MVNSIDNGFVFVDHRIMKLSELPDSFFDKRLANSHYFNAVVTKQPESIDTSEATKNVDNTKKLDLTKSAINNDPIFMVYTKDGPKSPATPTVSDEPFKKKQKSLWVVPCGDRLRLVWWIYTWPIKLILTATIPNPKTFRRLYPLTFLMCIIWIGLNAYMIVWMITIMG